LRIDLNQLRTDVNYSHARRHYGPNTDAKVDVVYAWHVPAGKHGLLNARALLRREVYVAGLTRRGGLARGLALLRLAMLGLTLLRSRAMTLLRRRLALLPRSLPGGVVWLLALAAILRLTLLILVTLALLVVALPRGLTGLRLVFLALLHLVLPARALARRLLLTLASPGLFTLASAGLFRRPLLAFALALLRLGFMLTLLRLSGRGVTRLTLLALLLGATLRLARLALLVACSRGAALHLRAAVRSGAG
jgi:hypothetical protein